ncbi:pyridoxine/pyridoxamine 5'-phosphate oxidase [Deinococcus malanensis]|uniref:Pyridoxine/pyridoxamine 5'-phosphate oxidase n=1 Tax=Deinococcus malanensis TaxID=1706855 RepID=A0ABQ2EKN4_9DEIO|nr:pyridoxamine 5'-phosphate oxidase [Deinococcus malanensis]GGK12061.1 pyridoxine/pyridoxamine 5'-phosphate oxidase [Deinococcus malanensis]
MTDLSTLRLSYIHGELRRADLKADPLQQFQSWLDTSLEAGLREPYAMSLATADQEGRPSVRTVLLRGAHGRGLTFFTNYESHKGHDLADNPQAEVLFYWAEHERQVRAYGSVERLSAEDSAAYFHSRPRESQLAAHASDPQSAPVSSRLELETRLAALQERFPADQDIPCPGFWGGYRIQVQEWEFWQGRPNRMHDRFRYTRGEAGWEIERLMP